MKYIAVLLAAFAAAPSAFAYTFTTCNAGCTGTGCGGQAYTFSVGPGSTQGVPGTQCIIWPANGEAGSWEVCNSGGSCTSGTNINCFDAEDGSGRKICNTSGTESIKIDS